MADYNHVYINSNGDVWVVPGEPGVEPQASVTRIDGFTSEQVAKLSESDWKLEVVFNDHPELRDLPTRELG